MVEGIESEDEGEEWIETVKDNVLISRIDSLNYVFWATYLNLVS